MKFESRERLNLGINIKKKAHATPSFSIVARASKSKSLRRRSSFKGHAIRTCCKRPINAARKIRSIDDKSKNGP
jgi:hypothetical protein